MDLKLRIVARTPLTELWNDAASMTCSRGKSLSKDAISQLLRDGSVSFVVAEVGKKLRWISEAESADFWKREARSHLAEPNSQTSLEQFPEEYCFFASQWTLENGVNVVLLEKAH